MSKIWIKYKKINNDNALVVTQNFFPFDKVTGIPEEDQIQGIFIEKIPEPIIQDGKNPILHINPNTKEMWYEYVDIPKTQEQIQQEKITALEQQLEVTNQAIAEVSMMIGTPTL